MYDSSSSHPYQLNSVAWRKHARNRGVILSQQGWQKLTGVLQDRLGNRYTYEKLSERSHLNVRTISRILSCQVKVDKRTLKIFFEAFNLHLGLDDYTKPESARVSQPLARPAQYLSSTAPTVEVNLSHKELVELCQRLMQDLSRICNLLDEMGASNGYFPVVLQKFFICSASQIVRK